MTKIPNIAFVYDWFDTSFGGAERVIQILHDQFPYAIWYTSHIDRSSVSWTNGWDIRTSFIQKLPLWFRRRRLLCLLLLPLAFESFDMSEYDVVVSITSAFAKAIVTRTKTRHICYLLTPPRWLYNDQKPIFNFQLFRWLESKVRTYLKRWDYISAQRVDEFVSISQEVAKRCIEYYKRESEVIYPPFDAKYWKQKVKSISSRYPLSAKQYYLIVSRLESYKKVDLGIEAYANFKGQNPNIKIWNNCINMVVVGRGSQRSNLYTLAHRLGVNEEMIWLDNIDDCELAWLYANCKAFIMPQEEDFGYVACEAMACLAPIIAFDHGGQVEVLKEYSNKIMCKEQTVECFTRALEKIDSIEYNANTYENRNIRRWSRHSFVAAFTQKITQTI